jgi:hypothetical protein
MEVSTTTRYAAYAVLAAMIGLVLMSKTWFDGGSSGEEWVRIDSADFAREWPFRVETGEVSCVKDGTVEVPLFRADTTYALTGHGYSQLEYADPDPIRRKTDLGMYVPLRPVKEKSLSLCK